MVTKNTKTAVTIIQIQQDYVPVNFEKIFFSPSWEWLEPEKEKSPI